MMVKSKENLHLVSRNCELCVVQLWPDHHDLLMLIIHSTFALASSNDARDTLVLHKHQQVGASFSQLSPLLLRYNVID